MLELKRSALLALRAIGCVTVLLAIGCVTPMTENDLERRLEQAAGPLAPSGKSRVYPIWAETNFVALALLTEARTDPESDLSKRLGSGIALSARRGMHVVVGGPYAHLTDQVLRNALTLQGDGSLRGLVVVFVSPEPPSRELAQAVQQARARLYHRELP